MARLFLDFWNDKTRRTIYLIVLLAVLGIVGFSAGLRYILGGLPSIDQLEGYTPPLTTRVYDVNNQTIAEFSAESRALIPLSKIPVDLQNAVIATEDDNFFNHWGVSPKGIIRALLRDVIHARAAQGGSTITQQLAKLLFLKPEKKIVRKIREVILAIQIERRFSKQEILEMYLNQMYLGSGCYGIRTAAKMYFGKDVGQLSLAECALLVGLIPAPNKYSPFVQPDIARTRRSVVLMRMLEEGYIKPEEKLQAEKEPIPTVRPPFMSAQAPYFVEYIRQILQPKYGENAIWRGGLSIYTTLDLNYQKAAEAVIEKSLQAVDEEVAKELAKKPREDFEAEGSTKPLRMQGAFLAMDVKSGAVRVMVGGRDYKETQFNRATQAMRQPGSTFKPFVWTAALMSGYTAATIVEDAPMAFYFDGRDWRLFEGATDQYSIDLATQPFVGNKDFKIWVPNNFGGKFTGLTTLRSGLEQSKNLVSIHLIDKLGPAVVVDVAKKAGVKKYLDPVPSLGLGTSAVPLIEMVNALATFANGGIRVDPYTIIRVEDQQGRVLEEHAPSETEVLSPQYSFLITNLMRGVVERGTATAARVLKRPVAGKTGTSQDHRDLWFIGMTPDLAAGAWMGYDDFTTIESKDWTGGAMVVPWWTEIMGEILKDQPAREFPVPDGISFVSIDPESGKLALPTCKKKFLEAFLKGTEPKTFCDIDHKKKK